MTLQFVVSILYPVGQGVLEKSCVISALRCRVDKGKKNSHNLSKSSSAVLTHVRNQTMTNKLTQHLWHKGYPFFCSGLKLSQVLCLTTYLTLSFCGRGPLKHFMRTCCFRRNDWASQQSGEGRWERGRGDKQEKAFALYQDVSRQAIFNHATHGSNCGSISIKTQPCLWAALNQEVPTAGSHCTRADSRRHIPVPSTGPSMSSAHDNICRAY